MVTFLSENKISIVLADDYSMFRQGLTALISNEPELEIAGQASDGRHAVDVASRVKPNVVIMDMNMPRLNGIEATRQILSQNPLAKVIIMSALSDRRSVTQALKAGASGYLLKKSSFDELLTAIRTVIRMGTYLSPEVTGVVVEHLAHGDSDDRPFLTAREREVVQLLSEGHSTKEVAAQLFVSVKTIESHRLRVMRKLGFNSLAQLTKYAIREGITSLET